MHAMCPSVDLQVVLRQHSEEQAFVCVCVCARIAVRVEVNAIFLPIKERTETGQLQIHGPAPCFSERPVS